MNNFNTIKRIHDLLIKAGFIHTQGSFDSFYHMPDSSIGFTLSKVVFNSDMTGYDSEIEDGDYKYAGYKDKTEWDTKILIVLVENIEPFALLTIMPDGTIKLA